MFKPLSFKSMFFGMLVANTLVLSLSAADRTEDLLLRVPASANVVAVIDVEGLFNSKLAVAQGWSRSYFKDYSKGLAPFPPTVQVAVLAAELNPESMSADWEFGVVRLKQPFSMKSLADRELTTVEKLEGHSLVTTAKRTYFLELLPQTVAITNHQNRQNMARWLRFASSNKQVAISKYLQETLNGPNATGQYRLALDLQDVPHLDEVRLKLQNAKSLLSQKVDLDALAKIITNIRGLQVSVQIGESIEGTVQLDFNDDLAPFAKFLPQLALDTFERLGVSIDELRQAKVRVEEHSLVFESTLSEPSFRRILSFLQPSSSPIDDAANSSGASDKITQQAASLRFFTAVTTQLNDLESQARKAKNSEASAHWFETYAKKIGQLPTREVDPDLLNYSASVGTKLRAIARSLRGVRLDVTALQFAKKQEVYVYPQNYYSNYGGVSYGAGYHGLPSRYEYKNNFAEVEAQQAKVIAEGEKDRQQIWNLLIDETGSMRSHLSRKFETEF